MSLAFGSIRSWLAGWLVGFGMLGTTLLRGSGDELAATNPRDTLVYKDGDRVQGKLMQKTGDQIVFLSDRFGELRVAAADAVVIPADRTPRSTAAKPAAVAAAPVAKPSSASSPATAQATPVPKSAPAVARTGKAAARAEAERAEAEKLTIWDRFTPSQLTARVRKIFGPWKGRLAFSTEIVSDTAERNNHSVEGRLARKWERYDLSLNGRYDFAETNNVPTTDVIKGTGTLRHDFNKKVFAHYRPTFEWNRASRRAGVPNDYILLQQEIGAGLSLLTSPTRKIRLGLSENLFDVWNTHPTPNHTFDTRESMFEETELALPWRMTLSHRGVWYPVGDRADGWENRIELNKKLTETLSTSVRHEIRRDHPDPSVQDFDRLKLLFALDF